METRAEFGRRAVATRSVAQPPNSSRKTDTGLNRESTLRYIEKLLFSFHGRISRLNYWAGKIGVTLSYLLVRELSVALTGVLEKSGAAHATSLNLVAASLFGLTMILILLVLTFCVSLAFQVRRWHDRDRSWPWALLGFIPIVGWGWQTIECGFLEGTPGSNRFGPSPRSMFGDEYAEIYPEQLA